MTARAALPPDDAEWLEADGLGGFASGTVGLTRTRRYHALLLTATTPPTGRMVLVSGFDAVVETRDGAVAISSQRYVPGVRHPDGHLRVAAFTADPWPTWEFALPDGSRIRQEILAEHGTGRVLVCWTVLARQGPLTLRVRPFVAGRDYHGLMHENGAFAFDAEVRAGMIRLRPYEGVPAVLSWINGEYRHAPAWYRQFEYDEERARGLDAVEDLASPGEFVFDLTATDRAVWLSAAERGPAPVIEAAPAAQALLAAERARRAAFVSPIERAADAYVVRRRDRQTIVAGYPWFTDWGRDTFIAVRGLCLATGRLDVARDILLEWAGAVSEGMLPNRFPDHGEQPEFNAVDASLWYVVAVHEFLDAARARVGLVAPAEQQLLERAILDIVNGYAAGTRFGIRMDDDGLLAAGMPGVQLTWMDAKVGDRVITPRVGKPVEVQALWINALAAVARIESRWEEVQRRATESFNRRFWNEAGGCLFDVVDVDHVAGANDAACRPNQILAVGGLPLAVVSGARARRIVDVVEQRLVTPMGLRSLAPGEAAYVARYQGDAATRDAAYHQGTVWPWLVGPFVEAWVRVRRSSRSAREEARRRFVAPVLGHLDAGAGLGHVSEIADAEPPFTPRGCPFQAWSLGEVLRLERALSDGPGSLRHASRRQGPGRAATIVATTAHDRPRRGR